MGRGSFEKDSPLEIVAMEKEQKTRLVHHHGLGKRQRHAHKTGESLAQGVIPALDMGGFSRLFAHGCLLLLAMTEAETFKKSRLALAILLCNGIPQALARLAGCDPQRQTPRLDGSFGTRQSRSRSRWLF